MDVVFEQIGELSREISRLIPVRLERVCAMISSRSYPEYAYYSEKDREFFYQIKLLYESYRDEKVFDDFQNLLFIENISQKVLSNFPEPRDDIEFFAFNSVSCISSFLSLLTRNDPEFIEVIVSSYIENVDSYVQERNDGIVPISVRSDFVVSRSQIYIREISILKEYVERAEDKAFFVEAIANNIVDRPISARYAS